MNYRGKFMTLYRRQRSRPSPRKRNAKAKVAVWGGLPNSCEKQRRKGKICPLECRVQRIAGRDKEAFLSDQCKEIEENNRMGKTGDHCTSSRRPATLAPRSEDNAPAALRLPALPWSSSVFWLCEASTGTSRARANLDRGRGSSAWSVPGAPGPAFPSSTPTTLLEPSLPTALLVYPKGHLARERGATFPFPLFGTASTASSQTGQRPCPKECRKMMGIKSLDFDPHPELQTCR